MKSQTPAPKTPSSRESSMDPVHVYCRLRPLLSQDEVPCIEIISPTSVKMSIPETAVNYRDGYLKQTIYTFSRVFDQETPQKTIFEEVALPLVDDLLHGKNGLLFAYGITGSGKTYTMTGTPQSNGIMPRALDILFNSVQGFLAKRFVFKPDRLNGFEVQLEKEAKKDERAFLYAQIQNAAKTPRRRYDEWSKREIDGRKIQSINEDNSYAVFVTYVEIYNNSVFDLLDENFEEMTAKYRGPQSKLVREDGARNMYVHGVNEVEVTSTDDAFEIFNKGMQRKRMAHNTLNAESSRSHSVFTVRLVQAPLGVTGAEVLQDKTSVSISQLSFVDLAGSERTNRTNTTGQRLREAGNINNSLMNLRTCLEILRENQINGTSKLVPYRDSKLTHLFKNFFNNACSVRMIVCVNPRAEDYDENTHVFKFAEMSQEVQVARPTPLRNIDNLPSGRRKVNQMFMQAMANLNALGNTENIPAEIGVPAVYRLASQFPNMCLSDPEDETTLKTLMLFLELEIARRKRLELEVEAKSDAFRLRLVEIENENQTFKQKQSLLAADLNLYKDKVSSLESQVAKEEKRAKSHEATIRSLRREIQEKDEALSKRLHDREREKQRYQSKIALTTEKFNQQMEMKLSDQKRKMELEMRAKERKLQKVKRILSEEALASTMSTLAPSRDFNLRSASTESLSSPASSATPSYITHRKKGPRSQPTCTSTSRTAGLVADVAKVRTPAPAVANPRHRRSRSTSDDHWLEHRATAPVPLNTVMQPVLNKRKSITKLTDVKDVANNKTSKYCLMTQEQDSEGDMETHVYKGDVVPTCGGGAQVILNDVEILKQKSPATSPTRKRSGAAALENVEEKCSVSIEGHSKKSKR